VSNLSHGNISDVSILLMGPTGTNSLLMAKIGGNSDINNVTLTFDDAAASQLTANPPTSGTYKPTQFSKIVPFPISTNNPALLPKPFGTNLSGFFGSNPNGAWNLYVIDDTPLDSGVINGGWSLNITTLSVVPPTADLVAGMTASPASSVVSSNVTYTITVTNFGPSQATGVTATDLLPLFGGNPVTVVGSTGSWSGSGGTLVCNFGTLAVSNSATATLTVASPASPTLMTNSVTVAANEADANTANNTATVVTAVNSPTADLAIGMSDSPDPVNSGNNLTYTIVVTNLGPATATGIVVTDTLPTGVSFVSVTSPGYVTNIAGTIEVIEGFTNNLGSGFTSSFNIVVAPTVGGTITNVATVSSSVLDPLKGNNKASVKTVVNGGAQVSITRAGANWTLTWPSSFAGMGLQVATNMTPPVNWTSVLSPTPGVTNGQYSVTLPAANGTRFYRLVSPWP